MLAAPYVEALRGEGFRPIGELAHRLSWSVWWNPSPDKLLQVSVLSLGLHVLIKGDKSYYLKSVSAEGETWARDIGLLHDYLEGHFPELRIAFSHFRDVPAELAETEARRRLNLEAPTQPVPTVEQLARLQRQLEAMQHGAQSTEGLVTLLGNGSDLLTQYLHEQTRTERDQIDQLEAQIERQRQRLGLLEHLQREYRHKGSAAVYTFSISSNLQVAGDPGEFRDRLRSVVRELTDMHRYEVMQKLGGGRLNIQVAEATEPTLAWVEQWFGGALSPAQLSRLGPQVNAVRKAAEEHTIVTPDEPITTDGHVRHAPKHVAARFVSDVLQRLDNPAPPGPKSPLSPERVSPETMPLLLGQTVDDSGRMTGPAKFPLTDMIHLYISGTTGGGKSFLARVLIEEAAAHEKLSILVLDPRNQSVGLLVPEDRPKILERYAEFGMDSRRAHGFKFDYFAPAMPFATPLPADLATLAGGRSIVSFKGLDDERRCALAAGILDAAFGGCSGRESESPRLLIAVDEAQLFTRKRVDEPAKQAAGQTERALDRIAREGRKFRIVMALVSQTMKDFGYELASIRQMTTTKIFLRNSDREIEYAADILGDGRLLVQLPTGTALMHNANWGTIRLRVRPPYSKVFELGEAEVRNLVGAANDASLTLSVEAQQLLALLRQRGSSAAGPLNVSQVAEFAGISSKRRILELIDELERGGVIRTRRLQERGQPRIIEVVMDAISAGCPVAKRR